MRPRKLKREDWRPLLRQARTKIRRMERQYAFYGWQTNIGEFDTLGFTNIFDVFLYMAVVGSEKDTLDT